MTNSTIIVLETLNRLNLSIDSNPNALVTTMNSEAANPEAAYCEIVQQLLKLLK